MPTDVQPLPDEREVGVAGEWCLPIERGEVTVRGQLLGLGSSRRNHHKHDTDHVGKDGRCSACRWFEVRIFKTDADIVLDDQTFGPGYFLHFAGRSEVPGEVTRYRTEWTSSGFDVLEALTTRREGGMKVSLTAPAARALASAASYDPALKEAYVERAVS